MLKAWEQIDDGRIHALSSQPTGGKDVVVASTRFDPRDKQGQSTPQRAGLTANSLQLLSECTRMLRHGGLLFIYGQPSDLGLWGEHLSKMSGDDWQMVFKYWIALDIDDAPR